MAGSTRGFCPGVPLDRFPCGDIVASMRLSVDMRTSCAPVRGGPGDCAWRLLLPALVMLACTCPGAEDGEAIMQRVLRHVEEQARAGVKKAYSFQKRSITEEWNAQGNPVETNDRTYQVLIIGGAPYDRLVRIGNRALTQKESQAEERKEAEQRRKTKSAGRAPRGGDEEGALTPELVARFTYKLVARETRRGRSTLVVEFEPRGDRKRDKTISEKVMGRLAGRLWIDDQDAELAQLQFHLTGELSLGWFGLIGSLSQCEVNVENQRLPDGGWVTVLQTTEIRGRKVLSSMHNRSRDECSGFKAVEGGPGG
jgi:hypothetical protein